MDLGHKSSYKQQKLFNQSLDIQIMSLGIYALGDGRKDRHTHIYINAPISSKNQCMPGLKT